MSLIKAYYVTRTSLAAGYTNDGDSFIEIPNFNSYFNNAVAAIGIDPNNGNKVIFAGEFGGVQTIKISLDNGNTLSNPIGGDWTTFNINVDAAEGSRFIVLDSNIYIVHGKDGIYKSIDGGETFNIVNNSFSSLVSFTIQRSKLWMIDEYNGILGLSSTVTTDVNKLFITSDGGITWTPILGYDSASNNNQLISAVYMTSDGSIMTVVRLTDILKSTDGGNTWQVAVSFTALASTNYGAGYYSVNDTVQYALGGNNTTFKTDNSGLGWASQSTDSTVNQSFLLSFYNEQEGYTSRFINNENKILRTFDSGVTWTAVDTAPSAIVTLESVLYNCGECPEDFTKSTSSECIGKSLGPNQCPQGSIYDPVTNTCTGSADCPPSEIVFVLDIGASVTPNEKQQMQAFLQQVVAADNITTGLNAGTIKLGFCVFTNQAWSEYNLLLTSNVLTINTWINSFVNINETGGTNTAAGLQEGITTILFGTGNNPAATKKLILVTDGTPESVRANSFPDSYNISNNDGLSFTYTINNNTTSPCGRAFGAGNVTDCTRCEIWDKTLEVGDFIKNQLNVHITVALLAEVLAVDLNTLLTPAENLSGAPSIESYLAYRALIDGRIDRQTHIFPPSQNSSSPYYVPTGYGPQDPIVGGHLSLTGFTNQTTGTTFGRLIWGSAASTLNFSDYSSTAGSWPALPTVYDQIAIIVSTTNIFNPYYAYDCDPSTFAPLCSQNLDGSNDVYVSTFAAAASVLAPQIALGICSSTSEVVCPEGCTPVPSGDNVRCECEKILDIVPCIYNIYECSDLTTPVFCTTNDISEYVGENIIMTIAIGGNPEPGCYQAQFSTVDYCDPLDFSDVTIIETYSSCEECSPSFTRLTSCMNEEIYIQVLSDYLTNNIGKSVELFEYPGLCWRVDFEPTTPEIVAQVTIKQTYDDCACCKQYSCKN